MCLPSPLIQNISPHLFTVHICFSFMVLTLFYWTIVDLQCCVSFRCTAKWFGCKTYIYILAQILFPYRLLQNIEYRTLCQRGPIRKTFSLSMQTSPVEHDLHSRFICSLPRDWVQIKHCFGKHTSEATCPSTATPRGVSCFRCWAWPHAQVGQCLPDLWCD